MAVEFSPGREPGLFCECLGLLEQGRCLVHVPGVKCELRLIDEIVEGNGDGAHEAAGRSR